MNDMRPMLDRQYSRGHQEEARRNCTEEFIATMENRLSPGEQNSNFLDHELSTQILSLLYQSMSSRRGEQVIRDNINVSK